MDSHFGESCKTESRSSARPAPPYGATLNPAALGRPTPIRQKITDRLKPNEDQKSNQYLHERINRLECVIEVLIDELEKLSENPVEEKAE